MAGLQKRFHPIADGVHRRLMACIQQENAGGDQLIRCELLSSFLGGDQFGDQIVARIIAAGVDILAQEGNKRLSRGHGAVFGLAGAAGHIHADHRVRPAQKVV